ncbi:MAG: hypothetical protein HOJ88_09135 [Proteobacteria bacterium]|jgi:hypothetical protein|nr:hypothetical protein [Pseudomonadota bacterium]
MAEKQTKTISINGTDYTEDQLTDQQKVMINHVADLDRKMGSAQFNLDQLQVGKQAFMDMLTKSLEDATTDVAAE